jgi:hypothetical protein
MPVDRGTIEEQLRALREGDHWWEQREFRELAFIMHPDERIYGLINGRLIGRLPRPYIGRRWLIVASNQRIICIKHGAIGRRLVEIWPGMITRVYHSSRLRAYHITIITTVQKYRIRIPKADAYRFVQALAGVVPSESVHRLSPGLEALSWVPGISAVAELPGVERMLSRATAITPPQPMRNELQRLQETVEQLQNDVERLTEQVGFLEQLLAKRAEEQQLLTETTAES